MFDIDRWQEIFETIRKNKLRTFLTGISVASGIFILVILLGFGQGMQNGIKKEFERDATNRIWVWTEVTTKEYKGLNPGRRIRLKNEDYNEIATTYADELEYKSDVFRVRGGNVNYKDEFVSYRVIGVRGNYQQIENQKMVLGRYINDADTDSKNKVIVISSKIQKELLKNVENPLEEYLQLSGINFKIIGVYTDPGGDREEDNFYIPITTAQRIFNGGDRVNNLAFTLKPQKSFDEALAISDQFTEEIKQQLKQSHTVSPDDNSAINTFNAMDEAKRYYTLTSNIAFFFWFVGICTIIAGVVGVSNIMLIIVKERTKEIGIRKALGAKPWAIIWMIMQESIFVTTVAGFAGLISSMALLEVVGPNIKVDYVLNPSVNFSMAISMVIILIVAGALAGFIPAWRAANIQPVKALSHE
ncbi:ABC transporter permease [Lutibacter sp. HS1-25]|uniref:ABC transporter permease n=1 Tax=Lutibacter sp. HS1-25 TaxID=2485000 RepID=UPI001010D7F9|nr:ABC transporter permease [Lutibacter sp. HS1-25]RXP53062.1 ABC transporter permease [Lutibacter sp. HS1-25]